MKLFQLFIRQNGGDQQNCICTPFDGFEDLPFIDDEIFAKQWKFYGFANLFQIIERALEKFFVGENGQTTCASSFVFFGDTDWIKIFADDSSGWRSFFD